LMHNQSRGFTLVELMVTVTILAVLTMVAITSYKYYIRRARSEEAVELLHEIKMKQEQYFSTYSQYIDAGTEATPFPTTNAPNDNTMWTWAALTAGCDATPPPANLIGWCHLGIQRSNPTYFRAVTIGWNKTKGSTAPTSNHTIVGNMTFNKRWYYAAAHGNFDTDSNWSTFVITSQHREVIKIDELE